MLTDLVLHDNLLTSTIPIELSTLPRLILLTLKKNMLTGSTIPTELGLLSTLEILELQESQLVGPIPSELGALTSLGWLFLGENALTSNIPSELGTISTLYLCWLQGNQLSGTIPNQLDVSSNFTSGTSLAFFSVVDNGLLSGTIPTGLCSIQELEFDCTSLLCGCSCTCQN